MQKIELEDRDWSAGRLSLEEADRYASLFTPAWHKNTATPVQTKSTPAPMQQAAQKSKTPVPNKTMLMASAFVPEPVPTTVPATAPAPTLTLSSAPQPWMPKVSKKAELPAAVKTPAPQRPAVVSASSVSSLSSIESPIHESAQEIVLPVRPLRKRLWAGIGASVVVVGSLVWAFSGSQPAETTKPVAKIATKSTQPVAAPTVPTTQPTQPTPTKNALAAKPAVPETPVLVRAKPKPSTLRIRIVSNPNTAQLTLDGNPISNPYEEELLLASKHTVQARASGWQMKELTFKVEKSGTLELRLKPQSTTNTSSVSTRAVAPPPKVKPPKAATKKKDLGAGFVTDNPY